jgi:uncharacterized protein YcaQ
MPRVRTFDVSATEARRIALAAQGFADRPPTGDVDVRLIRRVLGRIGLLQVDSVNVLARTQYLPLYSRLGPYSAPLLDSMVYQRRELFEYWGHEASYLPLALHPLMRWRMERIGQGETWPGLARIAQERPDLVERVYQLVVERGPISAGGADEPEERGGPWWGWTDAKRAFEWLFRTGRLAISGRRHFERFYDLPERVIPADVLSSPTPSTEDAQRQLLRIAARCHGIGTVGDLADYFRLRKTESKARLDELVEAGELTRVSVEGWAGEAYLDPTIGVPRRVRARALLSPFDSLVWYRERTERLFDFFLRLEIYTPAHKRVFGYYVLPFLLGERLVGRADLKADRQNRALLVHGAFAEAGQHPLEVAEALGPELQRMAGWLGLERVIIGERGELAGPLRALHLHADHPHVTPPPSDDEDAVAAAAD